MINLLFFLASVIHLIFGIFSWLIFIRAVLSWVRPDPLNPIVKFLHKTTEPIFRPIREHITSRFNVGIDLSPIIAFFIIKLLDAFMMRIFSFLIYNI